MKTALLFGINNYPNPQDRLRGCVNDINDMALFLDSCANNKRLIKARRKGLSQPLENPFTFTIKRYVDSECTIDRFCSVVGHTLSSAEPGDTVLIHYSGHGTRIVDKNNDESDGYDEALYLYDGPLIDDVLNNMLSTTKEGVNVYIFLDSCFSGTATRDATTKSKFVDLGAPIKALTRRRSISRSTMPWIVISGCAENQTSADAYINGKFNGAFTRALIDSYKSNVSIIEWFRLLRKALPSSIYTQAPTIEGSRSLFNNKLF